MAQQKQSGFICNTQEVMTIKESELVNKLKSMHTKELENHADMIMREMGTKAYSQIMASIMQAINDAPATDNKFQIVQKTLETLLPNKAYFSDIYERLSALVIMILARKLKTMS